MKSLLQLSVSLLFAFSVCAAPAEKINLLLITVDDMSCDSIGVFGCPLDTTPNIDQLAAESLRFEYAHVQVGNCFPSRNVMWSGRYSHNNGVEGFYPVKPIDFPVLCDLMKDAGYYTAIRGKVTHSTPYHPYDWDDDLTENPDGSREHMKDVESYHRSVKRGIENAEAAGKPFCLNINISDPHKPFWYPEDKNPASKIYTAEEVPVPGFLFDDPIVREELALYYTSVRRADDCVGAILSALEESGLAEDTFVMFLSDHGMPLPFAKTQLYHHSTWTPLIIKWPGKTDAGAVDERHMVSAVDFLPTLCDVIDADHPGGMDGRSFEPLLRGETQKDRDSVFKIYNENSGGNRHPIRAIETKDYLYIFNPWSDGENQFKTATQGTATYRRMKELALSDETIAGRLEVFDHRVIEELYDVRSDADCRTNLVGSEPHRAALREHRRMLERYMEESGDHALVAFQNRTDPAVVSAYMERVSAEAAERRRTMREAKNAPRGKKKKSKKGKAE